jgi:hypothetical protein
MNLTLIRPLVCFLILTVGFRADAFSLRGPNGQALDIGEEYRWTTPVVKYAFDQSFLDYFGPQGVKAVESALQTFNALPRASKIDLFDFDLDTRRINVSAAQQRALDLKSATMAFVLEQLGLAPPTEHIYDGDQFGVTRYHNFDSWVFFPSQEVNGVAYQFAFGFNEVPIDPLAQTRNAVADQDFQFGQYYLGLTRDDVGGLRYLLSRSNVNPEPPNGGRSNPRRLMWRGGVEKITFVRCRATGQPDFVFAAGDIGTGVNGNRPLALIDSTNWINCAAMTGLVNAEGPGIIRGPVTITFDKRGPTVITIGDSTTVFADSWGSFNHSTNPVVTFPNTNGIDEANVWIRDVRILTGPGYVPEITKVAVPIGETVALQLSANTFDWTTVAVVVNSGGTILWSYLPTTGLIFARAVPGNGAPPTPFASVQDQLIFIDAQRTNSPPGTVPPLRPLPALTNVVVMDPIIRR